MELDRLASFAQFAPLASRRVVGCVGAALVVAASLACGCSSTTPAPRTSASASRVSGEVPSNVTDTTNLMFAEIPGPAPRVGKAHLAVDDSETESATTMSDDGAPKEARRSDGSRRGGGFGTSSK